jgi:hypothetical protein
MHQDPVTDGDFVPDQCQACRECPVKNSSPESSLMISTSRPGILAAGLWLRETEPEAEPAQD